MPSTLDYASDNNTRGSRRRFLAPRWLVFCSIIPIVLFITLLFTHHYWSRWIHINQGWERLTGTLWIGTALFSLVSIFALARCKKRWDVWLCLLLHFLMLAFTVFPGCIGIPWLMHWMTGPGA